MLRRLGLLFIFAPLLAAADDPALSRFSVVSTDPVSTFIYVGTVNLAATTFLRAGSEYQAHYTAKVFPFFFSSESGTMAVTVTEAALRRLAAGELIAFSGTATRTDGAIRPVEGTAAPTSPTGGRLKVKIHVTKKITLVFDTSYHLPVP
jgi:hypothetical protein